MTEVTVSPNNFCATVPGLQFAWDSTSLGLLQECARKYYYQMLLHKMPRGTNIHLQFGGAYHKALEIFAHLRADGHDYDSAVLGMVQFCLGFDDGPYPDKLKNRFTLTRSCVWYTEHFKDNPYQTYILENGKPAVELSFRFGLDVMTPDGTEFLYCGHLDEIVADEDNNKFFLDRKTTKNSMDMKFFDQFSPSTQMSGYYAAGEVSFNVPLKGGIIDGAQLLVNGTRFSRGMLRRTPGQLMEWHDTVKWWMAQAQRYAEEQFWPMNEKACNNYGGCAFRPICSKDPKVREVFLQDYETFHWNPLEVRGDV